MTSISVVMIVSFVCFDGEFNCDHTIELVLLVLQKVKHV